VTQQDLDILAAVGIDVPSLIAAGLIAPPGGPPSDTTPPTTIAAATPAAAAGGWNTSDVTVALTASDQAGGSGVTEIRFTVSGAQAGVGTVGGASAAVPISAEGATTVTYFATDNAGNQESPKPLTVRIDKTPP